MGTLKNPHIYAALRAKGMDKTAAARISNSKPSSSDGKIDVAYIPVPGQPYQYRAVPDDPWLTRILNDANNEHKHGGN